MEKIISEKMSKLLQSMLDFDYIKRVDILYVRNSLREIWAAEVVPKLDSNPNAPLTSRTGGYSYLVVKYEHQENEHSKSKESLIMSDHNSVKHKANESPNMPSPLPSPRMNSPNLSLEASREHEVRKGAGKSGFANGGLDSSIHNVSKKSERFSVMTDGPKGLPSFQNIKDKPKPKKTAHWLPPALLAPDIAHGLFGTPMIGPGRKSSKESDGNVEVKTPQTNGSISRRKQNNSQANNQAITPAFSLDTAIAEKLIAEALVDCQNMDVKKQLQANMFELYEILQMAMFLSLLDMITESDGIYAKVQQYYEQEKLAASHLLFPLMLCRMKNLTKLVSTTASETMTNLVDQIESFCRDQNILHLDLQIDICCIRIQLFYSQNQVLNSFQFIFKALQVAANIEDNSSMLYVYQLATKAVHLLFHLKNYHHVYSFLRMLHAKRKKENPKQATDLRDPLTLEIQGFLVKTLYKMGKYTKAAKVFEVIQTQFIIDRKNQFHMGNGSLTVEIYCYGILIYIKLNDATKALQVYDSLTSTVGSAYDHSKIFKAIATCLKGIVMLSRGASHKFVIRYASAANRTSKSMDAEVTEGGHMLLFKLLTRMYREMNHEQEVEDLANNCIRMLDKSLCPYHLHAFDMYVSKLESLINRQLFTKAHEECNTFHQAYQKMEEFLTFKQISDKIRIRFSILMDLGHFDELESYLQFCRRNYTSDMRTGETNPQLNYTLQCIQREIDYTNEVSINADTEFTDAESPKDKSSVMVLLNTVGLNSVKYNLRKRDFRSAFQEVANIVRLAMVEGTNELDTKHWDFDLLFTCGKAIVQAAKNNYCDFTIAQKILGRLIEISNNTNDFTQKTNGMHTISLYLFHTDEKQQAIEYLAQSIWFLETKSQSESLNSNWDLIQLQVKSLYLLSKYIDPSSPEKIKQAVMEYLLVSVPKYAEELEKLQIRSKSINIYRRLKCFLMLSKLQLKVGNEIAATETYDSLRMAFHEVNNGQFCYLKVYIMELSVDLLMQKGDYKEAFSQAQLLNTLVGKLSSKNNNRYVQEKVLAKMKEIISTGALNQDVHEAFDDTVNDHEDSIGKEEEVQEEPA